MQTASHLPPTPAACELLAICPTPHALPAQLHTPQGQPERARRAARMVETMELEGFGACSNTYECEAACPKEISVKFIQQMNREYMRAKLTDEEY